MSIVTVRTFFASFPCHHGFGTPAAICAQLDAHLPWFPKQSLWPDRWVKAEYIFELNLLLWKGSCCHGGHLRSRVFEWFTWSSWQADSVSKAEYSRVPKQSIRAFQSIVFENFGLTLPKQSIRGCGTSLRSINPKQSLREKASALDSSALETMVLGAFVGFVGPIAKCLWHCRS